MNKILIVVVILISSLLAEAQKPALTVDDIKNWPVIRNEKISADGRVVMYKVYKGLEGDTLVVQSVDKRWVRKFSNATFPVFTANSQWFIYKKRDSLFVYDLKNNTLVTALDQIALLKVPESGNGQWIAYLTKLPEKKLVLRNLVNNKSTTFDSVAQYQFSNDGKVLLVQCDHSNGNKTMQSVLWVEPKDTKVITLMRSGQNVRHFVFDAAANQLAFLSDEMQSGKVFTTLRYFRKGMDSSIVRVNSNTSGLGSQYRVIANNVRFSADGSRIFFPLKKETEKSTKTPVSTAGVNIWHYDEEDLQTEQVENLRFDSSRTCLAVLHNNDSAIVQVNQDSDSPIVDPSGTYNGDYALVKQNLKYFTGKWRESTVPSYYAVNIRNGQRNKIISQRDITIDISSIGKYIVWYDPLKESWFSYTTATGIKKEITKQLAGTLTITQSNRLQSYLPYGIAGWLPNDQALLIYDAYDIWKIDPAGEKAPVNITNGYGRKHNITLRIWNDDNSDYNTPVIDNNNLLLIAFENENKNNGFFKASLSKVADPVQLTLGPYLYYAHLRFNFQMVTKYPMVKAGNSEAWLVRRMNSQEYPNLFFTRDFKEFVPMSDMQPQQNYNWLTSELISWKHPDSTMAKGILYKPQNFDPNKKYPVIFYFYERLSHRLHEYLQPELNRGSIDIPSFVSNGYLVCTPDISYTAGSPGESAYQSVGSAARFLSQMPWVDSERMGLQGHSFGGYEVNYIVSRTNMFSAAQESAGASDFISYYNGFYREHSAQFYFEYGQGRLGYTLWEKPELYFKNSPIFNADKVQTPLLIMHNKDDGEVPFLQGIEWFTALRRLGKKVWMLQYDKEHHGIDQVKNQRDFTIRVTQFFNHYLKEAPAPKWMVNGVPASLKGVETGLELMPASSTATGK